MHTQKTKQTCAKTFSNVLSWQYLWAMASKTAVTSKLLFCERTSRKKKSLLAMLKATSTVYKSNMGASLPLPSGKVMSAHEQKPKSGGRVPEA